MDEVDKNDPLDDWDHPVLGRQPGVPSAAKTLYDHVYPKNWEDLKAVQCLAGFVPRLLRCLDALRQGAEQAEADNAKLVQLLQRWLLLSDMGNQLDDVIVQGEKLIVETSDALKADHPGRALAAQVEELKQSLEKTCLQFEKNYKEQGDKWEEIVKEKCALLEQAEAKLAAAEGQVGELREALERIVNWDQALLREACKSNDPFKIMEAVVTMFNRVRDSAKATLTPRAQGGEQLQQLVAGITDENKHPEISFAPPLTWSKERPSQEGWWWYKRDGWPQINIVLVSVDPVYDNDKRLKVYYYDENRDAEYNWLDRHYPGSWAGPIAPPKE